MTVLFPNLCYTEVYYKGTALWQYYRLICDNDPFLWTLKLLSSTHIIFPLKTVWLFDNIAKKMMWIKKNILNLKILFMFDLIVLTL